MLFSKDSLGHGSESKCGLQPLKWTRYSGPTWHSKPELDTRYDRHMALTPHGNYSIDHDSESPDEYHVTYSPKGEYGETSIDTRQSMGTHSSLRKAKKAVSEHHQSKS